MLSTSQELFLRTSYLPLTSHRHNSLLNQLKQLGRHQSDSIALSSEPRDPCGITYAPLKTEVKRSWAKGPTRRHTFANILNVISETGAATLHGNDIAGADFHIAGQIPHDVPSFTVLPDATHPCINPRAYASTLAYTIAVWVDGVLELWVDGVIKLG